MITYRFDGLTAELTPNGIPYLPGTRGSSLQPLQPKRLIFNGFDSTMPQNTPTDASNRLIFMVWINCLISSGHPSVARTIYVPREVYRTNLANPRSGHSIGDFICCKHNESVVRLLDVRTIEILMICHFIYTVLRLLKDFAGFCQWEASQSFFKSLVSKVRRLSNLDKYQKRLEIVVKSFQVSPSRLEYAVLLLIPSHKSPNLPDPRTWESSAINARTVDQTKLRNRLVQLEGNRQLLAEALGPSPWIPHDFHSSLNSCLW